MILKSLLALLPTSLLGDLAVRHRIDADNEIRLPGEVAFVCLLNGLLNHPKLTQHLLEERYTQLTGQEIHSSTFSKYLARINPAFFKSLFVFLYDKLAAPAPQGTLNALRLRRVDATIVTLSAKLLSFGLRCGTRKAAADRRQVKSVFEISEDGLPNLLRLCREQKEISDCHALGQAMQQATQPGDFWVFDKGCHSRERLLGLHDAKGYWLTPHSQQAYRVLQVVRTYPIPDLSTPPASGEAVYHLVRVEQAVFENSYANVLGKRLLAMPLLLLHAVRFDARSRQWKPLVLMTNLPLSADATQAGPYPFAEVSQIYRLRWELEVFFKFLKQHLGYKHLVSRNENGITVLIYMSLIAALLMIWYQRQTGIDRGWKSVQFWLAEDARLWTKKAVQNIHLLSG